MGSPDRIGYREQKVYPSKLRIFNINPIIYSPAQRSVIPGSLFYGAIINYKIAPLYSPLYNPVRINPLAGIIKCSRPDPTPKPVE
jgi:hypothetical protein